MTALLEVNQLRVRYGHSDQALEAVRGASLQLEEGKTLGLVGESGCGKSSLALALMGLIAKEDGEVFSGQIQFQGVPLFPNPHLDWKTIRGSDISMVFQDPFSSLNPVMTIESQIQEIFSEPVSREELHGLLKQVQLNDPNRILSSYPHQLSGGQRQRVIIAIAIAKKPKLLIADEPTTALDVTVQDEIVKLLKGLQQENKMAMIFVTHNLGLVKGLADDVAVMYAGKIIEYGPAAQALSAPAHPYTQALLSCAPRLKADLSPMPVLEGAPPRLDQIPSGCSFHPRCPKVFDPCSGTEPAPRRHENEQVACYLYDDKKLGEK